MSDERPGGRMTPHPEKRLIAIDAEWVSLARSVIETIDAQAASALGKVLTAWDGGGHAGGR